MINYKEFQLLNFKLFMSRFYKLLEMTQNTTTIRMFLDFYSTFLIRFLVLDEIDRNMI